MREILFRGKRRDNGQWINGNLLFYPDANRAYITIGDYFKGQCCEVIRDTIGQYTGLTDKNGEQIFEGDILLLDGEDGYFKLEFDEDTARFVMIRDCVLVDFDNFWSYEVEVVGNIHDNQDLLEVEP